MSKPAPASTLPSLTTIAYLPQASLPPPAWPPLILRRLTYERRDLRLTAQSEIATGPTGHRGRALHPLLCYLPHRHSPKRHRVPPASLPSLTSPYDLYLFTRVHSAAPLARHPPVLQQSASASARRTSVRGLHVSILRLSHHFSVPPAPAHQHIALARLISLWSSSLRLPPAINQHTPGLAHNVGPNLDRIRAKPYTNR